MDIFYLIFLGIIAWILMKFFYKFDKFITYLGNSVSFDDHLELSQKHHDLESKVYKYIKGKNEKISQ